MYEDLKQKIHWLIMNMKELSEHVIGNITFKKIWK